MTKRSVLDIDPDLGAGLATVELPAARFASRAEVLTLDCGRWHANGVGGAMLLVGQGFLLRELRLGDRIATEILGPGDVIDTNFSPDDLLPTAVVWHVVTDTELAILSASLIGTAPPVVAHNLLRRANQRATRLGTAQAISQLPRVDDRVLAVFGQLAERWGRVTTEGVVVPLALTQETIGQMVGAARPTVSIALKALAAQDAVTRSGKDWVVSVRALERLRPHRTIAQTESPPSAVGSV